MLDAVAKLIKSSGYVIALTGAAISTESGIPDFRGPSGLWRRVNPYYATYMYFKEDPTGFWRLFKEFISPILASKPNPAHKALAEMEERGFLKTVITQNIDGLHQKAGSKNVIEVHGNLRTASCIECGFKYDLNEVLERYSKESDKPPRCRCGGVLKPDVVLFGEPLPYSEISRAYEEASKADLILVLGTSLAVYPAAYIPEIVKNRGGKVVIINMEPTEKDDIADILIHSNLTKALPYVSKKLDIV